MNLNSKNFLITGGTGSFGTTLCNYLLKKNVKSIRIFSRDENKQYQMRKKIKDSRVDFYIGDIRDYDSIFNACHEIDYVFHAAALKQVPSCEFYPMEAVKTNIIGTENLLKAASNSKLEKVVLLSTDKAVYPINAMGISKAMMEKVVVAKSRCETGTIIACTRYGNVMASRGSVIPLFINQIRNSLPITITDPEMTRFMMSLDQAVNLVLFAFEKGESGDIFVQKAPAATIKMLAKTLSKILGKPILLRIMQHYSKYGFKDFIIAAGYKKKIIENFFKKKKVKDWDVKVVDTGLKTMTGGRLKRLQKYLNLYQSFLNYSTSQE